MKRRAAICAERVFCTLLIVIAASGTAMLAQESTVSPEIALTETGKAAYRELEQERLFAIGGTGYSGARSKGENAVDILVQEREAEKALYKIATTNPGAGGLYGLFGLRTIKSENYKVAYKIFEKLPDEPEREGMHGKVDAGVVERRDGCLFFMQKRQDVAKDIDDGKFDSWIDFKVRLKEQKENRDKRVLENQSKVRTNE